MGQEKPEDVMDIESAKLEIGIDGPNVSQDDPNKHLLQKFIWQNGSGVRQFIKEQTQYWRYVRELWRTKKELYCDLELKRHDITILCRTYLQKYTNGKPFSVAYVATNEWAQEQMESENTLFNWEEIPREDAARGAIPMEILAQRMINGAQQKFETESCPVEQCVEQIIDENVRELVLSLNKTGISVEDAYLGDVDQNEPPSIFFPISELEKTVSLMLAWKNMGGIEYRIRRHPQVFIRYFEMIAPKSIPVEVVQRDLESFRRFLQF